MRTKNRQMTSTLNTALLAIISCASVISAASCSSPSEEEGNTSERLPLQQTEAEARQQRQDEVDAYLAERAANWEIVDTRTTPGGAIVDYVTIESRFPKSPNAPYATPPERPELSRRAYDDTPDRASATVFQTNEYLRAPEGTLPIIRPQYLAYVEGRVPAASLTEYRMTMPKPTPNHAGNRLYASYADVGTHDVNWAWVNTWNFAEVGATSQLSNAQLSSECGSGGSLEAIEAGVQVSPHIYDSSDTLHTFIYFRTAGGSQGAYIGGYNEDFAGFVPQNGAPPPGAEVDQGTISTIGGTQYACETGVKLDAGNWWVLMCGEWLGYYPTEDSTTVDAEERIAFDLIEDDACTAKWYGEVADDGSPSNWTNADMGSGKFGHSNGNGQAAYIRNQFVELNGTSSWFDGPLWTGAPMTGAGYDTGCYTGSALQTGSGSWTRYFYYGGGGNNAPGGNCD